MKVPDGAGKTTLVNHIIEKYHTQMIHSSNKTKNDFDYHMNLLDNNADIVYDRFNLGEIVYTTVYKRPPKLSLLEQQTLMTWIESRRIPYIIFYASDFNTLRERLFSRGDTEEVLKNAEDINELFRACAAYLSRNYSNVYALDISKEKDQVAAFEAFIKKYKEEISRDEETR